MTEFNYSIDNLDDAIDYVLEISNGDLKKALTITQAILSDTNSFTGPQALIQAIQLAGLRIRIGTAAQYYKQSAVKTKNPVDRLIKDALLCIYDALPDLINALKLKCRFEVEIIGDKSLY